MAGSAACACAPDYRRFLLCAGRAAPLLFTCRPAGNVRGFGRSGRTAPPLPHARHVLGRSPRAAIAPPKPPSPWGALAGLRRRAPRKQRIVRPHSILFLLRRVHIHLVPQKRSRATLRVNSRPFGRHAPRIFRGDFFDPILCNNHRLLQVLTISLTRYRMYYFFYYL